jgi:drug/metabolite transporter (DMT)-like permease
MLLSILYEACAALAFGGSDILVTLQTRRYSVLLTLIVVQAIGCVLFLLFVGVAGIPVRSSTWSPGLLLEGAGLGVATTLAYLCFYEALKKGPLALVSPISASYGAITVSLAVVVLHEAVALPGQIGIVLVLCGTVLASIPGGAVLASRPKLMAAIFSQGTALAILAMIGFGLELFFLSALSKSQGPVLPVLFLQGFMVVALTPFALADRNRPLAGLFKMPLWWGGMLLLCGLLNAAGLVLYTIGTVQGVTSIVALLSSAYSLLPMLVGVVFLREHLARWQAIGVTGLLIGVVLLSTSQGV